VDRMAIDRITWRDAQQMPDDGKRYEAIEGELYVTPAPRRLHQRVSHLLAVALHRLLAEPGYGEVYEAPFGVEFPATGEGAQPDLLFVSTERLHIIGEDGVRGAPDLVVEILSPTTAARDRGVKLKLCRRHGVAGYWIVDPEAERVEVWDFAHGAERPTRYTDRVPVHVGDRIVGELELTAIFGR
jgi:Uma2 family endonuclease